jgi:hypothetical protein
MISILGPVSNWPFEATRSNPFQMAGSSLGAGYLSDVGSWARCEAEAHTATGDDRKAVAALRRAAAFGCADDLEASPLLAGLLSRGRHCD